MPRYWNEALQKWQKEEEVSAEQLYQRFVSEAGLFGKAFFGHRKTRKEARKLRYLWVKACFLGGTDEQKDWARKQRSGTTAADTEAVHRAGVDEGTTPGSDPVSETEE